MAASFKGRGRGNSGGGGYLHGVTGVINSITFKEGKKGENKNGPWTMYSIVPTITPDGGSPTPQFLDAGFLPRNAEISKDGKSIVGGENYYLDPETPAGKFVFSLVEGRETGNFLSEDALGDGRNYDGVAGTRVTFARVRDTEGTIAAGARKLKIKTVTDENRDKCIEAGKRVDKKDKTKKYFLDNLLVTDVVAAPAAKKGGKKATTTTAAAAAPATVGNDAADAALTTILGKAEGKTLLRDKLSSEVLRYTVSAGIKGDAREALRLLVISDDYIASAAERDLIALEGEGKAQALVLIAA